MFFVNGSPASPAGNRTKMFAKKLPCIWDIQCQYRLVSKWKSILSFSQSALKFRPDIIYVMDTAYTGVLAGYIAKKLTGCKLITDTGDVAYELAKSTGNYSKAQLILINWIEQMAIANSDYPIVRGSYHKIWLEKQGIKNVAFIPDGVDLSAVKLVDPTNLRTELELENNLVVGLIGTMSWSERHQMCYGWDLVEALALLKDLPVTSRHGAYYWQIAPLSRPR